MAGECVQRRLATILASEFVGYSRLMEQDETGTLVRLKSSRSEVFDPRTKQFDGRVFKNTADGALEGRRRFKIIPSAFGEKLVMKLMFSAMAKAAKCWRPIKITTFEQRQMEAVREELDHECKAQTGLAKQSPEEATANNLSGRNQT